MMKGLMVEIQVFAPGGETFDIRVPADWTDAQVDAYRAKAMANFLAWVAAGRPED